MHQYTSDPELNQLYRDLNKMHRAVFRFGATIHALKLLRDPVAALEAELGQGRREAVCLAASIWRSEYKTDAPDWTPLETTAGVISQIDNMYAGVRAQRDEARWELNQARARIAELEARTGPVPAQWRPIGEAPRDTPMQVMTKKFGPVTAIHKSGWHEPSSIPGNYPLQATHYRALPAPPTQEARP